MSTGPEHFQAAELLLDLASQDEMGGDEEQFHLFAAQVHATLALAAATALPAIQRINGGGGSQETEWAAAITTTPPPIPPSVPAEGTP